MKGYFAIVVQSNEVDIFFPSSNAFSSCTYVINIPLVNNNFLLPKNLVYLSSTERRIYNYKE